MGSKRITVNLAIFVLNVIRSVWDYSVWSGERYQDFRVNDSTGKIEEKK